MGAAAGVATIGVSWGYQFGAGSVGRPGLPGWWTVLQSFERAVDEIWEDA